MPAGTPSMPPSGFGPETTRARGPGLLPGDESPVAAGSESTNQGNARWQPLCMGWEALLWCPRQTGVEQVHLPGKSAVTRGEAVLLEGYGFPTFGAWLPPEGADTCQSPSGATWAVQPALLQTPRGRPACRWRLRLLPALAASSPPSSHGGRKARHCPCFAPRTAALGQAPAGKSLSVEGGHLPPW